ncbi:MAG: non-homologous end-joining DNA ligase [Syntrophobacteraceae bacterium]
MKQGNKPRLTLTNPKRILYPEIGSTKGDLAEYYMEVADWILPHLLRRPLTLVRCPEGWEKECFYQKHLGDTASAHLRSIPVVEKDGQEYYSVGDDIEGVVALVQIGVLEIRVWGCRDDSLDKPDMMIFDLDPAPDVVWDKMIKAAYLLRDRLSSLGLSSFLKTTGGKGLHVVVPLIPEADWDMVKAFSRAVAERIVREFPHEYIATMSKEKRKGKIFIDYLRNGRGATSIAAYSTRKRRKAPISTPIAWEELTMDLQPDSYNIGNIRQRPADLPDDPWEEYFSVRQTITEEMKKRMGL